MDELHFLDDGRVIRIQNAIGAAIALVGARGASDDGSVTESPVEVICYRMERAGS